MALWRLVIPIGLILTCTSWAQVDLYVFKPSKSHYHYLIPVRDGQKMSEELELYKARILENPELRSVVGDELLSQLNHGQIQKIENIEKTKALVLANRSYDHGIAPHTDSIARIRQFSEKIDSSIRLIILPVASTIYLNNKEKEAFYKKISQNFSGVIALGGPDVAPELYNEPITKARDTKPTRDHFEIDFIKDWIQRKAGFLYGVCRGHQLISVALGFKLKQHIDYHGDGQWETHKINLLETTNSALKKALGVNTKSVTVNSYHHQAVEPNDLVLKNSNIEIAAVARDGTIEALTSKDGSIFTTQFHPEFMDGFVSKRIFTFLSNKILESPKRSCKSLFH